MPSECRRTLALATALLPSPFPRDVIAAGCGEGFRTGGSCSFSHRAEGEEGHCRRKLAHFPFLQAFLLKTQAVHLRGLHCLS